MSFKLKLHHGGFFQRDPVMQYVGTSNFVSVIDIDVDKWSFFEAIGILKEDFGYGDQPMRLWWKGGDGDYKEMTMDNHALELFDYVIANSCEVELFVEYVVGNEGVVDNNFCEDSSNESLKNVELDESEEEKAIGLDDGFDLPVPEIGRMKNK